MRHRLCSGSKKKSHELNYFISTLVHEFSLFISDPVITNGNNEEAELTVTPQKLLILDARSYTAAVANRAKGGGCECPGKLIRTHLHLSYTKEALM